MRVWITNPPGLMAQGTLKEVIMEQGAPDPHMVIEMAVAGSNHPVEVTLNTLDLATIVRLARKSKDQKLRDAVR